jgi:hypothetical protein
VAGVGAMRSAADAAGSVSGRGRLDQVGAEAMTTTLGGCRVGRRLHDGDTLPQRSGKTLAAVERLGHAGRRKMRSSMEMVVLGGG